ncbi:MAG: response regulator [Cytophagales bacterium]|nr:response regulator [Armatimonadota bacterium]
MRQASVLIVDDDPIVRLDLRTQVVAVGYTVAGEADSGGQALALARNLRPDLVLLDIVLPTISGIEVARTLMAERIAPVVIFTGSAGSEVAAQAYSAGVMGFLSKPLRAQDLGPIIAIAIARFAELITLENEVKSLNARMEARRLVGRAKAILMEKQGMPERDAFRRIQAQSLALGKPVHEIAQAIIMASEISA